MSVVRELQETIFRIGDEQPIPERFYVKNHGNMVELTDLETGRTTVIPLFAYRDVRRVLNDFFGETP